MINQQKSAIREEVRIRKQRFSLDEKKEKSINIISQLEALFEFKKAKTILAYWSMNDEVYTHELILKYSKEKTFILPVVKGEILELRKFTGLSNMTKGLAFGISEPQGKPLVDINQLDLIIVPGIAFDKKNNRLGRGKAYYDKLLKSTLAFKVGVCFDFQLLDDVPVDMHDIKMDMVITESE